MNIKLIDEQTASKIIEKREPIGKFYVKSGNITVGIDNSTGDCWVEEFNDMQLCMNWLNDSSLSYFTETDFNKSLDELQQDNSDINTFEVIIIEKLVTSIFVNAKTKEQAIATAKQRYDNGKIVLSFKDFSDVEFKI